MSFIDFQLTLKRSNTLELEDVQEDVSEDIDMGMNNIHYTWLSLLTPIPEHETFSLDTTFLRLLQSKFSEWKVL